jgi:hypothetical protein
MSKQIVPKDASRRYERVTEESPKWELRLRSYEGFKLID